MALSDVHYPTNIVTSTIKVKGDLMRVVKLVSNYFVKRV